MKILITGSSGMLGTCLSEALRADHELIGIDVVRVKGRGSRVKRFYEASITDLQQIRDIFDKEKPDLVIHAAAWTDVDGCEKDPEKAYEINTDGTRNIAEASGKKDIPVIFISTDFVFDGKKGEPYIESDAGRPLGVYGRTKWQAEKILKNILTYYVIVRTSGLYGQNGGNFVDTIVRRAKAENRLRVVKDQIGSPTYAKDLTRALKEFIGIPGGFGQRVFHVSNSGWCSRYDLALRILDEIRIKEKVVVEPILSAELTGAAPRPAFSALDSSAFQEITGHRMRSWEEALADYIRERYK